MEHKTEDIQKLGEQIRTSNEAVIQNLKVAFNEELKKAVERLQETFQSSLDQFHILESGLRLITTLTNIRAGSRDCWKEGYFTIEDVKSGYDARRPITDDILASIEGNLGTIIYAGPYEGKSVILKRLALEEIKRVCSIIRG